jgi:fibronectin-binding autotransporter adhesin
MSLAAAAFSLGATVSANAAVFTYTRSTGNTAGTPDSWSAGDNWAPSAPASGSDTSLEFTGTLSSAATVFTNNDLAGNFHLNQLDFTYAGPASGTAPAVTISGNPLDFFNDSTTSPTLNINATGAKTPTLTISNNIILDNVIDGSLVVVANSNATLSGVISSGFVISGLNLTGSATVTVGSANTYTGSTILDGGVLQVGALADAGNASSIGTADALIPTLGLVFGGGTLRYVGTAATSTNRLFTIGDTNGNDATLDNSSASINSVVNWTNTGAIAFGSAAAHTLTFTGAQGTGNAVFNSFAPLIGDAANPTTVNKTGANSLWSLTNANTYSGGTNISAGFLQSTTAGGFGSGDVTVSSGGTAWANGAGAYTNNFSIAGTGAFTKFGGVGGNLGAILLGPGTEISGTITLLGDATIASKSAGNTGTPAVVVSGKVTGNFALTLGNGTGIRNLYMQFGNAANDYTGGTTFAGENRAYGAASSSGTTSYTLLDDEVIPNGINAGDVTMFQGDGAVQTLDLNGHSETINGLNSDGAGRDSRRLITNSSTTPVTLTLGDNNASGTFLGVFADGATNGAKQLALTKIGTGNQVLTGATGALSSAFSGDTTITAGTLTIDFDHFANVLGGAASNFYSTKSAIHLNGGTLAIAGRKNGSDTAPQPVTLSKGTGSVTVADTTGLAVGEEITPTANIASGTFIVKIDGNLVSLSKNTLNTSNTPVADTFATTAIVGSTSQSFDSLTLDASSALDFGSAGNIALTFGSITQALDGSVLTINNWAGSPDTLANSDQLLFTGAPSDFTSQFDQNEVIFSGYGPGYAALDTGNGTYQIVPTAATTTVPEPASLALLTLGAAALLTRRKRF